MSTIPLPRPPGSRYDDHCPDPALRPQTAKELIFEIAGRVRPNHPSDVLMNVLTIYLGYRVYGVEILRRHMLVTFAEQNLDDFQTAIGGKVEKQRTAPGLVIVRVRISDR